MKKLLAAMMAVLILMCACSGARISAPAEEVKFVKQIATATVLELVAHYVLLIQEDRPPTEAEAKYWEAKLDSAYLWYLFLLPKVREDSASSNWMQILMTAMEMAK